jgi:hypothetical protein
MTDVLPTDAEDLREGWIIEANDAVHGEPDNWRPVWESWFIEDNQEAARIEEQYALRGETWVMKPGGFELLLGLLKKVRPYLDYDWRDYRFKNVSTGMIIHAWLML